MVTTGITSQNITCIYSLLKIRRKYAQEQETGEKRTSGIRLPDSNSKRMPSLRPDSEPLIAP